MARLVNAHEPYWADSIDRRNTSIPEVLMGRPAGWMKALTGRSAMKSPGAPSLRRDVERLFWHEIARGLTSEDAATAVGVSQAAGSRWFRERGGMPTFMVTPLSGRYLSFEEREEIAVLKAEGAGPITSYRIGGVQISYGRGGAETVGFTQTEQAALDRHRLIPSP